MWWVKAFSCRLPLSLVAQSRGNFFGDGMMKKNIAFVMVVVVCFAFSAQAYIVENFSFEDPGDGKHTNWEDVPGWSSDVVAADSGVESAWPGSTEGVYAGYLMQGDPSVSQLTSTTIEAGEEYILSVDARNNYSETGPGILGMFLYYDYVGFKIPVAIEFVELTDGWQEYSISLSADDIPSSIGNQIGIEMINASAYNSWVGIDNVRLTPEPATMMLLGLGGLLIRKRR
jgi:hypothetical protein